MKKCKKPCKGQKYQEGARVRSLRPVDGAAAGQVVGASRKRTGWCYSVLLDKGRVVLRAGDELEAC